MSDPELAKAIRQGGIAKEQAIYQLHDACYGFVFTCMKKYRLNREDAGDAYADAVIALSSQVENGKYRSESSLSSYLFKIFMNKAVDKVRKNTTHKSKVEWADELPEIADANMDLIRQIVGREDLERAKVAMQHLGERCRQLLWDMGFGGYKASEMVDRMGFKNAQVVFSQRFKCLKQLARLFGE